MATASPSLSEDHFLCSICLDVFTEPVSVPCGHNFCKACIDRHWKGKEQCHCPLCNEKFNKGLKLRVNTGFRDVVENFKKHHVIPDNNSPVNPGQVPCDCCLGNKFKAAKTCLVCLTSYCETHLEPHQRVAALKRHKLTNPVHDLEDKICKRHNRILEFYCRNDLTCVCVLCTEHSAHDTVPLEEAYVDKRAQMGKKKAEVQEMKHKRGKKGRKRTGAVQSKREDKNKEIANSMGSNEMQAPHFWCLFEGPHQFNTYLYLPENMGCSGGNFCYEIEANGRSEWFLGVVRESILRKSKFKLNTRNGNWFIRLDNTNCQALHNVPVHFFLRRKPERIMVFVDYDDGLVSFYDADNAYLICTFTGCKFNESIFLFHCPIGPVSWVQRLRSKLRNKVQKLRLQSGPQDIFLIFMFFFIFLFSIMFTPEPSKI